MKGKCKEDFEKWYESNYKKVAELYSITLVSVFYTLPLSMQYGVYVDFFDSVGIHIEISKTPCIDVYYYMVDDCDNDIVFNTRHEARTAAIEKATEIYNKKFK